MDTREMPHSQHDLPTIPGSVACVVLAHAEPTHVRRLIDALAPFPVFLHCDSAASDEIFTAMTADLPGRCVVLGRHRSGWAGWGIVEAEVAGYRQALAQTSATHFVLLQGSDYPLASTSEIQRVLSGFVGRTVMQCFPLPNPEWGWTGGIARLRYRHWAARRRMLRLPIPRRIPSGLTLSGGSLAKVISREHAAAVVRVFDERPDLVRFWRRSWAADETFVPTVLMTPSLSAIEPGDIVPEPLWWMRWYPRSKSPAWIAPEDLEDVLSRRAYPDQDRSSLFGRKFKPGLSDQVLDAIDTRRLSPDTDFSREYA